MQALFIPIYAFAVTSGSLGAFDYSQTIAGIAAPIVYISIWEAVLRFCIGENSENLRAPLATVAKYCLCIIGLSFLACVLCSLVFTGEDRSIALAATLMTSIQGLTQVWQYMARAQSRSDLYMRAGIIGAFVYFLLTVLTACVFRLELFGLCLSYLIGQVAIFVSIERECKLIRNAFAHPFSFEIFKKFVCFSSPLILNLVSLLVLTGFGRVVIASTLGFSENGLYVFAVKFGAIVTSIGGVVSMALVEETILRINDNSMAAYFKTTIDNLWKILISVAIVGLPAISLFYCFLGDTEYVESFYLISPVLLYAVFSIMATNYGNAFQAALKMKEIAFTSIAGMIVTVVATVIGVPIFGPFAAACALAFGMGLTLIARRRRAKELIGFQDSFFPVVMLLLFTIESFGAFFLDSSHSIAMSLILFVVSLAIVAKPAWSAVIELKNLPDRQVG